MRGSYIQVCANILLVFLCNNALVLEGGGLLLQPRHLLFLARTALPTAAIIEYDGIAFKNLFYLPSLPSLE